MPAKAAKKQTTDATPSSNDENVKAAETQAEVVEEQPTSVEGLNVQSANIVMKKISPKEKKVRIALEKMGLQKVGGIARVCSQKGNTIFVHENPDVYEFPGLKNYVIFGTFKGRKPKSSSVEPKVEKKDTEVLESTGLEEKDVKLVMSQANISRNAAICSLRGAEGNVVKAIMDSIV